MTLPPAEAIFLSMADVDPADRAALLDIRCGSDADLRREVEALIASIDGPGEDFLDPGRIPALDLAAVDGPLQPGTSLGTFLVLHALGSGGMGVVYAAQQDRPRRTVAIKVLRRGFRQPEILRRFEHEAETLGRLQHPGIAQVYAFFPGDRAVPAHLVMELVSGPPITDYARARQLSIPARVELAVKLAHAVQHAHERGVIHRDLKPANVLVAEGSQPKVLDFGIARTIGVDIQRITHHTAHGQLMGTLAYMSPEQLRGPSGDADGRSDVYALGVLLYRLLADRLPFDVGHLPWPQAIQHVLESEPLRIGLLNPALAGPLERIVARAMARDVAHRYQSAADLAADLERFLDGRAVTALEPHVPERRRRVDPHDPEWRSPPTALSMDDGAICLATRGARLVARSASTGEELWNVHAGGVCALAAGASGPHVAAGFTAGSIAIFDVRTGARVASFDAHRGPVLALAFDRRGPHLMSAGSDGAVCLWDPATGHLVTTLFARPGHAASLMPLAGGRVAVAWDDGRVDLTAAVPTGL